MFGFIETMVFHISTPWVLLRPWFSVYSPCEYCSDYGFPKSTVIAAIQPMASIRQERVVESFRAFGVNVSMRTLAYYSFHRTPHGGAGSSDKLKFDHTFI